MGNAQSKKMSRTRTKEPNPLSQDEPATVSAPVHAGRSTSPLPQPPTAIDEQQPRPGSSHGSLTGANKGKAKDSSSLGASPASKDPTETMSVNSSKQQQVSEGIDGLSVSESTVGDSATNGNGTSTTTIGSGLDIPTTHTILSNPQPALSLGSLLQPTISTLSGTAPSSAPRLEIDSMISRLLTAGYNTKVPKAPPLKNAEITAVCLAAREVFLSQPTLIELSPPVKIVGDVHGQFSDLIRMFEMCGFPPQANFLFLGDYVDRGKQSLETILLLLCYKIKYPENFFLLRGNHEAANVTRVYGFYDECKRRCNIKIWKGFIDVFNTLPIAAVVASKIFCVHGGLSPSLSSMDDIRRIQRPTDVPDYGLLNDLLWSDPSDTALDWEDNERGVSYCFGKSVINQFLATYDMDLICRAHMVVEDGYEFWNERTLVTVFSAPNYCGEFDNYAAVMSVSEDLLCAFELLKPLNAPALRKEMTKAKRKSLQNHQSPPSQTVAQTL